MVAAQGEGEEWKKNLTEGGRALQLDNEPADDQITKATLIDNSQPLKARSKSFRKVFKVFKNQISYSFINNQC
jgi:hypothetical protein